MIYTVIADSYQASYDDELLLLEAIKFHIKNNRMFLVKSDFPEQGGGTPYKSNFTPGVECLLSYKCANN